MPSFFINFEISPEKLAGKKCTNSGNLTTREEKNLTLNMYLMCVCVSRVSHFTQLHPDLEKVAICALAKMRKSKEKLLGGPFFLISTGNSCHKSVNDSFETI